MTEWISVKDRLPLENDWVLVVINGVVQYSVAARQAWGWDWLDPQADSAPLEAVTDWQPMPEPPKEKP